MNRTAAVQWLRTIFGFCLYFVGSMDAICSSTCLDLTAPVCNETTGECLYGCIAGYAGFQCHLPCGENCLNCSVSSGSSGYDTVCNQCATNHFKNGSRCELCHDTCRRNVSSNASLCYEIDGHCIFGCKAGYYGPQCDKQCNNNCLENTTSSNASLCYEIGGHCIFGCKAGYYGSQCDKQCNNNCLENTTADLPICDLQNGTCSFGCKGGLTYGPMCDKPCSHLCMDSVCDNDGTCRGCRYQLFGRRCSDTCPRGCIDNQVPRCHQNGTCKEGCKPNFWGLHCVECSTNCVVNISQEKATCNETNGHCSFGCEDGYYGLRCDNECNSNCLDNSRSRLGICDRQVGTCTFGCKPGRYGQRCEKRCSLLCDLDLLCERDGTCRGCRYDHYGHRCDRLCSKGCVANQDPRCHQNGTCKEGCETNFWGPTCITCNENCLGDKSENVDICRESDGFCLQGCKAGKYGMNCSGDCPENCKDNMCYRTSGQCINKCRIGFYGEFCNNSCSPNCLNEGEICFSENGTCIAETCAISWFGLRCQNKCSVNCVNNSCDRNSGICPGGCSVGYFGNTCEANCLNGTYGPNCAANCSQGCVNVICNPDNGKCECTKSYIGARCDTKVKVYTEATPNNAIAINLSSIAGVVLLGTVIMVIVTICKCREDTKCFKPKETGVCEHTYENSAMQAATSNRMLHAETAQTTTNDCIVTENLYDEIQEEDARADKTLSTNSIENRVSKNSDRVTVHDLYEDLQRSNIANDHYYAEVSELSGSRL